MKPIIRPICVSLIAISLAHQSSVRAAEDAPPPDIATILQSLDALEKQHQQQETTSRQRALSEAQAAASDPNRAAALWEQAEKVSKDTEQFREWKEKEGSALDSKEVRNALRIHFNWLVLSLQKSGGAKNRDLLPAVINHTKDIAADQLAMEAFEEQLKRQKELADKSGRGSARDREKRNDEFVRALHNRISGQSVRSSPVAQMLRLGDVLEDAGMGARRQDGAPEGSKSWESGAFNIEGIYQTIILPELRAQKDQRILEYYDNKIRQGAEKASKTKSPLEIDKFNQVARPQIQWDRAAEMETIGMRNRAIAEMFSIVKANPAHPDVENWMKTLRSKVKPETASTTPNTAPTTAPTTRQ